MNKQTEALKLALEALEMWCPMTATYLNTRDEAITAIREALAEQPAQQEPVAWLVCSVNGDGSLSLEHAAAWEEAAHEHINDAITEHSIEDAAAWVVRPAYTSPPASKPLTDELNQIEKDLRLHGLTLVKTVTGYAVLKLGQITAHGVKENNHE